MKRLFTISLMILICLQLCSCGLMDDEAEASGGISIWYRYKNLSSENESAVAELIYPVSEDADRLHEALKLLTEDPKSEELVSALPSTVHISSYSLSEGKLDIYLTGGYSSLNTVDKNIARCCLVMTLCSLKEVDYVNIYQEAALLEARLTPSMMIIENNYASEYEQEITLYFPDAAYSTLYAEKRQRTVASSRPLAEYVIDELLKGTKNSDRNQALPEGTRLLFVSIEAGLCTVDFSKEFYINRPLRSAAERLMLFSVINTLTELEDITHVQFKVEGEKLTSYTYMDISEPFERAEEFIRTGKDYWEESSLNVYLGTSTGKLAAVKVAAGNLNYDEWASSVINYYVSLDRFWGYKRLIPEGTKVNSIEVNNKQCRLDLSREFTNGSEEEVRMAARAIAATLYDNLIAERVIFYAQGKRLFFNRSFTKDESLIVP